MRVFVFDLLPYAEHLDHLRNGRELPYPLPRRHFKPDVAVRTYEEHLTAWEAMDRLGYDGVGFNEHHTSPYGLMNSPNLMARLHRPAHAAPAPADLRQPAPAARPAPAGRGVLQLFTAVGTHRELAKAVAERFGGAADTIALSGGYGVTQDIPPDLVQDLQRIPSTFAGFPAGW